MPPASHPITTSGMTGGDITTQHQNGDTTGEWEDLHTLDVMTQMPTGAKLTTSWTSSAMDQSIETIRLPNESERHFRARHILDYTEAMGLAPPIP
jgi:hypothetical protein